MHCVICKRAGKELTIDGDMAIPRMYSIMVNVLVFVTLTTDVFILGTEVAHAMQVITNKRHLKDPAKVYKDIKFSRVDLLGHLRIIARRGGAAFTAGPLQQCTAHS